MVRKHAYLLPVLGILVIFWYLAGKMWGLQNPLFTLLRAVILSVAAGLAGVMLVRSARQTPARVWLVSGVLTLAALVFIRPIFHEHEPNVSPVINLFPIAGFLLPQLLPYLALVVSAFLLYSGLMHGPAGHNPDAGVSEDLPGKAQENRLPSALAGILSLLVLAGGLYHIYWLFVWDSTYDPIDIFFLIFLFLPVTFCTVLLSVLLSGRQRPAAGLYFMVVSALILVVFVSAKQVDFRTLTQARADRVSQALYRYYERYGVYPDNLSQLVPWTVLSIPEPVIMYGQNWCYQGARDWYRLGYVNREHWSSPHLFPREVSSGGYMPTGNDLCAAEISLLQERYGSLYGLRR